MSTKLLNRSFARRIGKTLSGTQKQIIEEEMDNYILKPEEITNSIAEIGIGMGEHFINLCKAHPDKICIGFEPYLNGIANSLLLAKKAGITNLRLWPDDMDLVFHELPKNSIQKLYILFPDPWPKTKQKKRRIICEERIKLFAEKMPIGGELYFASDIEDYYNSVIKLLSSNPYFKLNSYNPKIPHENYIKTKYHNKAEIEGRVPQFCKAVLCSLV